VENNKIMAPWRAVLVDFAACLFDGARAAVFLPRREMREQKTPLIVAAIILFDIAALILLGRAAQSGPVTFDPAGVQGALLQAGGLAFSSAILVVALANAQRLSSLLGFALSISFAIDVAWNALWLWPATTVWIDRHVSVAVPVWAVSQVWLGLALACALARQSVGRLRKLLVFIAAALIVTGPLLLIDRGEGFWSVPSEPEANQSVPRLASEELLYGENGRLDGALDALTPRTPGRINVYFVGFAGNGSQAVFMREVIFVKDLFEKRFGAVGHTVALINNPATAESVPLATITSLHDSLVEIGKRMTDEDILVLFLTSHGSAESGVNIELKPFDFDDLDPATLKDMLDDAHIRQRVVIVSACYSGIFVKPLEGPNALVITAADASHSSFGCSNEADFTYFGEAYFADGLSRTTSLTEAFEIAKPIIRKREDGGGYRHSNPQMALGTSIEKSLARLDQQLKATTP
jgi:hypothetical protein